MAGIDIEAKKPVTRRQSASSTQGARVTNGPGAVSRTRNLTGEKRKAGRPPGAKNKPKSMVPAELADELLVKLQGTLPDEHYQYLKGVVKKGDAIATEKELDILILLLGRNLHPALIEETLAFDDDGPDDDEDVLEPQPHGGALKRPKSVTFFRKDVTERLKVLNSLLSLRHQMEKTKDEQKDGKQPLITIVADRNLLDGGRLGVLLGGVPGPVAGNTDGVGRPALPARTVSD